MQRLVIACALALVAGVAPASADTVSPGYRLTTQAVPGTYSFNGMVTCTLPGGDVDSAMQSVHSSVASASANVWAYINQLSVDHGPQHSNVVQKCTKIYRSK